MMIDNEGQGLIFDNGEGKEKNPNAPDFTGQINVGGEQFRIALWWKEFANGEGFSVNIQPTEGNYSPQGGDDEDEEDEVPVTRSRPSARKSAPAPSRPARSTGNTASRSNAGGYKKPTRKR